MNELARVAGEPLQRSCAAGRRRDRVRAVVGARFRYRACQVAQLASVIAQPCELPVSLLAAHLPQRVANEAPDDTPAGSSPRNMIQPDDHVGGAQQLVSPVKVNALHNPARPTEYLADGGVALGGRSERPVAAAYPRDLIQVMNWQLSNRRNLACQGGLATTRGTEDEQSIGLSRCQLSSSGGWRTTKRSSASVGSPYNRATIGRSRSSLVRLIVVCQSSLAPRLTLYSCRGIPADDSLTV
jgi:hypothetical protein